MKKVENESNLTIISPDKLLDLVNTAVKSAIMESTRAVQMSLYDSMENSIKSEIQEAIVPLTQEISNFSKLKVYSIKELARILNLSEKTVYKYCKNGTIKASRSGSGYVTTHQNLMKYLEPIKIKSIV